MERVISELTNEKKYPTDMLLRWIKKWHSGVIHPINAQRFSVELDTVFDIVQEMTKEVDRRRDEDRARS